MKFKIIALIALNCSAIGCHEDNSPVGNAGELYPGPCSSQSIFEDKVTSNVVFTYDDQGLLVKRIKSFESVTRVAIDYIARELNDDGSFQEEEIKFSDQTSEEAKIILSNYDSNGLLSKQSTSQATCDSELNCSIQSDFVIHYEYSPGNKSTVRTETNSSSGAVLVYYDFFEGPNVKRYIVGEECVDDCKSSPDDCIQKPTCLTPFLEEEWSSDNTLIVRDLLNGGGTEYRYDRYQNLLLSIESDGLRQEYNYDCWSE